MAIKDIQTVPNVQVNTDAKEMLKPCPFCGRPAVMKKKADTLRQECPYYPCEYDEEEKDRDALAYIRQLEAERDELLQPNGVGQPTGREAAGRLAARTPDDPPRSCGQAERRPEPTKWISAETPPLETKDKDGYAVNYLIYDPENGVDIGSYIPEVKTWFCVGMPCNVTHWAGLPYGPGEYEKMMKQLEEAEKIPGVVVYAHGDKIEIMPEEAEDGENG